MVTVLQFISSLSDGGAETLVKDYGILFNRYSELNIRCIIVTLHCVKDSANYNRLKDSGVEVITIYRHHNPFVSLHRRFLGIKYVSRKIYQIIKSYDPVAIHVHLGLLKYLQPISKKLQNIKLFYTCHNEPSIMFGHNDGEKEAASYLIDNNNLRLIALHDEMRRQLDEMFGTDNTIVVNNGVDIARFRNVVESKEEIRKSLNIPDQSFVIGHIGRFSDQKNHAFIIRIFARLLELHDDTYLILIGTGPLKHQILQSARAAGIHDRIIFLSRRTDIPQLLKCMDVFLFPSLFEGLSVTLIEAQAAGLRCVISDRIKPYNVLSETTVQISLDDSVDKWCEAVLDRSVKNDFYHDIMEFDIRRSVESLSVIYNQ